MFLALASLPSARGRPSPQDGTPTRDNNSNNPNNNNNNNNNDVDVDAACSSRRPGKDISPPVVWGLTSSVVLALLLDSAGASSRRCASSCRLGIKRQQFCGPALRPFRLALYPPADAAAAADHEAFTAAMRRLEAIFADAPPLARCFSEGLVEKRDEGLESDVRGISCPSLPSPPCLQPWRCRFTYQCLRLTCFLISPYCLNGVRKKDKMLTEAWCDPSRRRQRVVPGHHERRAGRLRAQAEAAEPASDRRLACRPAR
jgi:hypothetical protein